MSNANIEAVRSEARIAPWHGPRTGKSGAMNLHHGWGFRDGEVVLYRGSEDTALVAERLSS